MKGSLAMPEGLSVNRPMWSTTMQVRPHRLFSFDAKGLPDEGSKAVAAKDGEKRMLEHKTEDALHFRTDWLMRDPAIIGDAVIITDFKGLITSLNPIAESLTGWTQGEATGLSLESVFKIVDPETRMTIESPTVQALRNGVKCWTAESYSAHRQGW